MTDELKRLMRRWAALPSSQRDKAIGAATEPNNITMLTSMVLIDLLEECARVGAELEEQNTRRIAADVADGHEEWSDMAYQETHQRVRCALDNCSYGNGQDAIQGATDALNEWIDRP